MQMLYASNFLYEGLSDGDCIADCLESLRAVPGERAIVLDGRDWNISRAILLSSNMTRISDETRALDIRMRRHC